jgi:hypothetical protein
MKLSLAPVFVGLLSLLSIGAVGCAPAEADGETTEAQDAELGAEEQSFSSYDATDEELADAADATASDHELTLFAIPAPRLVGLSWKRPGGLARRTLVSNGLGLHRSLGHAAVRVQCAATSTRPAEHFQGSVVSTGDDFRTMVLDEKAGLGVLLRTVPGALETEAQLQPTLDERYQNGRLSFLRFRISPDTCHALVDYARAFQKEDVAARYGFVRPLNREGAGCSAFSMAFLELARLDEPAFRSAWSFDVRVPLSLVGGADNPGNKVTVLDLFTTFRGWAGEDEPHRRLVGWDPTKMFTSIRTRARSALRDHSEVVEKRGRALGLVLDRRTVKPRPELSGGTYWAGPPGAPRDYWGFGDP